MLTKLIKYEFRSSRRVIPLVLLGSILLAAVGALASLSNSTPLLLTSYTLLMLAGSAVLTVVYILVFVRFYRSMYGAEGYLAQTVPADAKTLYNSKMIVSFVWLIISFIITLATWAAAALLMVRVIENDGSSEEFLTEASLAMSRIFTPPFVLWAVASTVVSMFAFLAIIFFCITLSSVKPFSKLGIGSSILAYIVVMGVEYIVTFLIMAFVPLSMSFHIDTGWTITNQTMMSWFASTFAFNSPGTDPGFVMSLGLNIPSIILAIVLPIITIRLLERKLIVK